ncbi:MAG: hypothetical protein M3P06_22500 [Acidobacteriota bacterium]|nr:hypothetical protein [Acidobacteriota bacterium]
MLRAEITYVCQSGLPNTISVYDDPFTGWIGVNSQEEPEETFCFPPMIQGHLSGCGYKPFGRGGQPIVFELDPVDSDKIYHFAVLSNQFANCTFTTVITDGTLPPVTITNTIPAPPILGDAVFASHRPAPRTPAAIVQFDTPNQDDGKILISKALWDIGYPSALQRASSGAGRAEIRIAGTRRDSATHEPRAGLVHLRVIDPPDSAPYRGADARDGDNDGTPATINGAATATIQTDPQGRFDVTLVATSHVAGDNYQVAGSADASFNCGTACQRTAIFTLWKRIYVEEQQMFRRGSFLNNRAEAGTNEIPVEDPAPFQGLASGEMLQLVHAESGLGEGFYFDFVAFDSLQEKTNDKWVITTAPATLLPRDYGAPDLNTQNPNLLVIRDGVGVVSAGTFETNPSYAGPLFASMFVELKPIASAVTEVPYLAEVHVKDSPLGTYFANHWLQQGVRNANQITSRPDPNVFHRIAARQAPLELKGTCHGAHLGATVVGGQSNFSYIFDQRIRDVAAGAVADPNPGCAPVGAEYLNAPAFTLNGETTAHETVHLWIRTARQPGLDGQGHCSRPRYADATNCLLHTPYAGPELYDGQVLLHYDMSAHSEYMWVRRDPDPVPQQ